MTVEEDTIAIMQGITMVVVPILTHKTVLLWQGVLAGGETKNRALNAFCTDPLTIMSVIVGASVLFFFLAFTFVLGWLDKNRIDSSYLPN